MKNLKILIAVLALFTLLSCNDDDGNPVNTIDGQWRLARVSGGLTGIEQTFMDDTIKWEFHPENNTLVVVNNNTDENLYDGLESGTYSYTIVNNPNSQDCTNTLLINNETFGCVTIEEFKLTIDDSYADGFKYELYRKHIMLE